MNGDGRVGSLSCLLAVIVEDLDVEQLLADKLVPICEEVVPMEALAILAALGDVGQCKAHHSSGWFAIR
jgi:hypothetical protein